MKRIVLISIILSALIFGQGTWLWNGRVHPELKWSTITTENFNIHYHQGIEEIAKRGASIAEQVRPVLMKQVGLESLPRIDVIFTTEDEIMNGYALWSNMTFIWVDQNDAAIWLEDVKWLNQVLSHELQHIVQFNAMKAWLPEPWNYLLSNTPAWFMEGTAEYYTEKWRPYRADLSHKYSVLKNKLDKMDPHHDGFSKLLYLSDRFGDSTVTNLIQDRNKLKLFKFDKAFKKHTGVSVNQFEEDWRRHMNTYYYGYRAQKEPIEEIGETTTLPVKQQFGFAIAPDSMQIIIACKNSKAQRDVSLYLATRDTIYIEEKNEQKTRPVKWKLSEVDYGKFHRKMTWAPNSKQFFYAKYHYGKNQSMIWDLRLYDVETKKQQWITNSMRASWPDWSPDGNRIVFVAHKKSTSNLFFVNPDGTELSQVTNYENDIQLISPTWSPSGTQIAFSKSSTDGNMDIYLFDIDSAIETRLTDNISAEYYPIWHPDEQSISFTSHYGGTPNIHTIDIETGHTKQITDVGDAVFSWQWTPNDTTITAITLADVDTIRIVKVDPNRDITSQPLALRDSYSNWRIAHPLFVLPKADAVQKVKIIGVEKYRFYKHPRHLMSLVLPEIDGGGLFGITAWSDALGKHILQAGGGVSWSKESEPWMLLSYLNAEHGPLFMLNYFYNAQWRIRPYDRSLSGLVEKFDGIQIATQIPFNFHNSLSSNHLLTISIALQKRSLNIVSDEYNIDTNEYIPRSPSDYNNLPIPEEGNEGVLSIDYQWLNRRPNTQNAFLPKQGYGLQSGLDVSNKKIYGDFSYAKLNVEGFSNAKLFGPLTLFSRIKTQAMFGEPAKQDSIGLTKDFPIYLPNGMLDLGILSFPEVHNPRGWNDVRLGNRLIFGTMEVRIPLVSVLPINILGLSVGSIAGALISDFGNAWKNGEKSDDWIVTAGYEIKFAIQAGSSPILNFAVGEAQTIDDWNNESNPQPYFRFALINPF